MKKQIFLFIFIFIFYSIWGLHLFAGLEEYRCRSTDMPPRFGAWLVINETSSNLCGEWDCPVNSYCRNPYDYEFSKNTEENKVAPLLYGYTHFDDIFSSLFTVLHFTSPNIWSTINFIY
eukprot:TRINITY_DN9931_c0_g1_i1.p2 TRINITY_DN9931_c0_g1~~TRINITY_DN9931_c0_g1_i1.p2  ORF type:complete len:119 (+),score=7.90 TRINITY_DN9931_c0_g1_i1:82-438(+)